MEEKSKQKSLYWFAILFFFGYLKPVSRIFVSWSTKIKGKHMEQNETITQTKNWFFWQSPIKCLKQLSTMTLNLHNKNNFTCSDILNTH